MKNKINAIGLAGMLAVSSVVSEPFINYNEKNLQGNNSGQVVSVDEETLNMGTSAINFEYIRIRENIVENGEPKFKTGIYLLGSPSPIEEGDVVDFSYMPKKHNIHWNSNGGKRSINIQGLTGIIYDYKITESGK